MHFVLSVCVELLCFIVASAVSLLAPNIYYAKLKSPVLVQQSVSFCHGVGVVTLFNYCNYRRILGIGIRIDFEATMSGRHIPADKVFNSCISNRTLLLCYGCKKGDLVFTPRNVFVYVIFHQQSFYNEQTE